MRWIVEISPVDDGPAFEKLCLEAPHWQPALQRARELHVDESSLGGVTVEFLEDGCLAVDSTRGVRYRVSKADDDEPLVEELGASGADEADESSADEADESSADEADESSGDEAAASSDAPDADGAAKRDVKDDSPPGVIAPPDPEVPPVSQRGQQPGAAVQKDGSGAKFDALPTTKWSPPDRSDSDDKSVKGGPGDATADSDVEFELVEQRRIDATDERPLCYLERSFSVTIPLTASRLEGFLQARFEDAQETLDGISGRIIELAVYDHRFDGEALRPPIAVCSWREWQGDDPVISLFPYRDQIAASPASAEEAHGKLLESEDATSSEEESPPADSSDESKAKDKDESEAEKEAPEDDDQAKENAASKSGPVSRKKPFLPKAKTPSVPPSVRKPLPAPASLRTPRTGPVEDKDGAAPLSRRSPLSGKSPEKKAAEKKAAEKKAVEKKAAEKKAAAKKTSADKSGRTRATPKAKVGGTQPGGSQKVGTSKLAKAKPKSRRSLSKPPEDVGAKKAPIAGVKKPAKTQIGGGLRSRSGDEKGRLKSGEPATSRRSLAGRKSKPPVAPDDEQKSSSLKSSAKAPSSSVFGASRGRLKFKKAAGKNIADKSAAPSAKKQDDGKRVGVKKGAKRRSEAPRPDSSRVSDAPLSGLGSSRTFHNEARRRASTIPPRPSVTGGIRVGGDELLTDLFEAISDLHFLTDALEGADFVLALALEKLPSEVGLVSLFDIDTREYVVIRQTGGSNSGLMTRLPEKATLASRAMKNGRAVVVANTSEHPDLVDARWTEIGTEPDSLICAPVESGGRYLGLVELANPNDGRAFAEGDGHALTYIARQYAEFVDARGVELDTDKVLAAVEAEAVERAKKERKKKR